MHPVFDTITSLRVNPAADIRIGDRVWLGSGALILKGVTIGNGSIIGARAVLTKDVPMCCAAAGNPARVLRHHVSWDFALADAMTDQLRDQISEWEKKSSE
jgi:acetyltransferase-like isoleucine patch superfamily enzyme